MAEFELDARLAADTTFISDWGLSQLRLMNDARYPWLVLVPQVPNVVEIHDLEWKDCSHLMAEIHKAAGALKHWTKAAKINIGALGNVVPQLHVHIVARNPGDPAWPGPVWGHSPSVAYEDTARAEIVSWFASIR